MKSRKRETTKGKDLRNQESIKTLGKKENNKYLWILEMDTVKETQMKELIRKSSSEEPKYF